jgi:SAM-dependent methyltransferase
VLIDPKPKRLRNAEYTPRQAQSRYASTAMALAQFVREYRTVRRAEGWGSLDPAYYRALPYRDLTGQFIGIWRIRARSYDTFLARVLQPLEQRASTALSVVDVGAGSGWLAYRLAWRGHRVIAVDVLDDPLDGLRATQHYPASAQPRPVLADFDQLPLPAACLDLAIFNASLHYSTDYCRTLAEALRVLVPGGTLVILDSPMYSSPSSGARMVQEREARFVARYGFASNALSCENFLTPKRLSEVADRLGIRWQSHAPRLDLRTSLSRTANGLRARREPTRFPVIVGTRV